MPFSWDALDRCESSRSATSALFLVRYPNAPRCGTGDARAGRRQFGSGALVRATPRRLVCGSAVEGVLDSNETVGLAWIVLLAFIRLIANERIFPSPMTTEAAF